MVPRELLTPGDTSKEDVGTLPRTSSTSSGSSSRNRSSSISSSVLNEKRNASSITGTAGPTGGRFDVINLQGVSVATGTLRAKDVVLSPADIRLIDGDRPRHGKGWARAGLWSSFTIFRPVYRMPISLLVCLSL